MTDKSTKQKLEEFVENALTETEFELVLLEYGKFGGEWVMRVYIDHPEGVNIEHCTKVTRTLLDLIEEDDPLGSEFRIEVSSPGVDRPLVKPAHFSRFEGERIFVKTVRPIEGSRSFTGILVSSDETGICVTSEHDGKSYGIPFEAMAKATLKPELNFS